MPSAGVGNDERALVARLRELYREPEVMQALTAEQAQPATDHRAYRRASWGAHEHLAVMLVLYHCSADSKRA